MTKQRSTGEIPANEKARLQEEADYRMDEIRKAQATITRLSIECNNAVAELAAEWNAKITPFRGQFVEHHAELLKLMKTGKAVFFDGTDVVRLTNGSLIHSVADKVSIPRDALARCEELGFAEVVKIAKSLDREAVEKWPDERLILIGAERKPKEEFSYDLAEVKP